MAKEVKDQYRGVQIKSSLGRRLFHKSIVLGIPKRGNVIFRVQRVWLRSWGQGEATARAQSTQRHSQWVMVKRILQKGFTNFNKETEMRPCTQCAVFSSLLWVSIIEKLEKKNVLKKPARHYFILFNFFFFFLKNHLYIHSSQLIIGQFCNVWLTSCQHWLAVQETSYLTCLVWNTILSKLPMFR